jgi:hypothetical protein
MKFTKLLEDIYASQYKIKKVHSQNPTTGDWEWHDRKVRTGRINFKNSKMAGEPAQKDDKDMKEAKDSFGMPSHSHDHVMKKIKDGHWEAQRDVIPGKHLEVRDTTTKNIKTIHVKPVKEETMTIDEQINEVLSKDATAGDWIHDFVHSDNPKFADKSKDKRKEMALAAYYAKQQNEEVELDEAAQGHTIEAHGIRGMKSTPWRKTFKSHEHLSDWADKNDSVEVHATRDLEQAKKGNLSPAIKEAKDEQEYGYEGDMAMNQLKTLVRCAEMIKDLLKPDTDMPEWVQSKITLATDYIQTAADYLYSEMNEEVKDEYARKVDKHLKNKYAPVAPVPDRKYIKGTPENKALKASRKPINGHPTNIKERTMKSFKEVMQSIQEANHRDFAQQGKMHHDMAKHMNPGNEMDFYHPTTGDKISGVVKHNSGKEVHIKANKDGKLGAGDVHKFTVTNKLDEALKGSQHKLDKNKNGKVDAHDFKILRGEDDIKEDVLDELSKSTLGSYAKKASRDAVITRKIGADFERKADAARSPGMQAANTELSSKYKQKSFKRRDGLEKAVDRLSKEEVETRTVSFSDFITQLNEYTPGKDGVTRIQGKSYGAQYRDPEGEDDAFDRKPKQVAKPEPEVKRGRGRPAGSKSGANQKVTSGTKRSGVDYSGYKLHLPNSNR